jgi:hypothetical protein
VAVAKNFIQYVGLFITFYTIAMGFSFHNLLQSSKDCGVKKEFIRTPKLNIEGLKDKWKQNNYSLKKTSNVFIEGALMLYFNFRIYSAFLLDDFSLVALHAMLFFWF